MYSIDTGPALRSNTTADTGCAVDDLDYLDHDLPGVYTFPLGPMRRSFFVILDRTSLLQLSKRLE